MMPDDLQSGICANLVKQYTRGMLTLVDLQNRLQEAQAAVQRAETSEDPAVQAKLPTYQRMAANYSAALVKCMKKALH
jgi:uncharacterized membrane protein (DUF106 family)